MAPVTAAVNTVRYTVTPLLSLGSSEVTAEPPNDSVLLSFLARNLTSSSIILGN